MAKQKKYKCISVRQPWAWLIVNGYKDVENRSWNTEHRGDILIHASKVVDKDAIEYIKKKGIMIPDIENLMTGGIVGKVCIVDVVTKSKSKWHEKGCFAFVLNNAEEVPFVEVRGKLGIFEIKLNGGSYGA